MRAVIGSLGAAVVLTARPASARPAPLDVRVEVR